ncbi:4401_t:CDS:2 [Acaulospora colombiana]|uniref:4401_t:CDS:1 n=1 Tax=Acaulospora colombiana TaxID=27376 RepID=A0ACA9MIB9_9GLOM|nr:4401_t:CDS:2 [Acaulospora colombiana]
MDSDPQKRPTSHDIYLKIKEWNGIMKDVDEGEIKKQFLDADRAIDISPIAKIGYWLVKKSLDFVRPITKPDNVYASKLINKQEISKAIKGSKLELNDDVHPDSMLINLCIND